MSEIERNPGPEFTEVVTGSFNQSNMQQVNSLYGLASSIMKDVRYWTAETLDSIVEHRALLYKAIGKDEFLGVEELPNVVKIFDESVNIQFKFNSHGLLSH